MMRATFIESTGEASWKTTQPWDIVVPRLANFPEPSRFNF
jgi:protein-L-isoaspartate(D-aspartate) O-methyltransferase